MECYRLCENLLLNSRQIIHVSVLLYSYCIILYLAIGSCTEFAIIIICLKEHEFPMAYNCIKYYTSPGVMLSFVLVVVVAVGLELVPVVAVVIVVVSVILSHMYVAGSVFQFPSPVQVAVMVSLGRKPSLQVKVMDDPSNVVV